MSLFTLDRLVVLSALTVILASSCVSCVTRLTETERVYVHGNPIKQEDFRNSIVRLRSLPGENGSSSAQATGFAITSNHLLTAGHYCNSMSERIKKKVASEDILVEVSDSKGMIHKIGSATIVASAIGMDACLLELKNHGLKKLNLYTDFGVIEAGDRISVHGAPHGYFLVSVVGQIISLRGDPSQFSTVDSNEMFLRVSILPGSSGSPVMWNGKCIGIVVKYVQGMNGQGSLATRSDDVMDFLKEHLEFNAL